LPSVRWRQIPAPRLEVVELECPRTPESRGAEQEDREPLEKFDAGQTVAQLRPGA
jgi:hypothetical protein